MKSSTVIALGDNVVVVCLENSVEHLHFVSRLRRSSELVLICPGKTDADCEPEGDRPRLFSRVVGF